MTQNTLHSRNCLYTQDRRIRRRRRIMSCCTCYSKFRSRYTMSRRTCYRRSYLCNQGRRTCRTLHSRNCLYNHDRSIPSRTLRRSRTICSRSRMSCRTQYIRTYHCTQHVTTSCTLHIGKNLRTRGRMLRGTLHKRTNNHYISTFHKRRSCRNDSTWKSRRIPRTESCQSCAFRSLRIDFWGQ
jgi:hypothetical protein